MLGDNWSPRKRMLMSLASTIVATIVTLMVAEIAIRAFSPQRTMYPRWQFSPEYGAMLFPGRTMVHETPGRWRFTYTINEFQYRGEAIPIADTYERSNVVVLGDSYSFGTGVNDGEEYAAVIAEALSGTHDVVNLSVGGWGLAQQIRRYYEFGVRYRPDAVILQFCDNDLRDNFRNQVTVIEDGDFSFRNSRARSNWVKKFLSDSWIQRSQLYNLVRQPLAVRAAMSDIDAGRSRAESSNEGEVPADQQFHNELLELFARKLAAGGVDLILTSAGTSLDRAPFVRLKIRELERAGLLEYHETQDWLGGIENARSAEGHLWGKKAHAVIGERLAAVLRAP